jgi:hypothetical protein
MTASLFTWLIIRLFQLVFSARTVFFSHDKSVNSVFQPAYQPSRTGPASASKRHVCLLEHMPCPSLLPSPPNRAFSKTANADLSGAAALHGEASPVLTWKRWEQGFFYRPDGSNRRPPVPVYRSGLPVTGR